jgi:hypothetical protein
MLGLLGFYSTVVVTYVNQMILGYFFVRGVN